MFFKKRKLIKSYRFLNKGIYIGNVFGFELNENYLTFIFNNKKFIINFSSKIKIYIYNKTLFINSKKNIKKYNCLVGVYYSIINNILFGLNNLFEKKLILVGTGYKAFVLNDKILYLYLGFSHPVIFKIPIFVNIYVYSNIEILISGNDKQKVFQTASNIKKIKKPDPYKGKGIRYLNENINLKEIKKK